MLLSHSLQVFSTLIGSPHEHSLLQAEQAQPPHSFLMCKMLQYLYHFCGLSFVCPCLSFTGEAQDWTQNARCGLISAAQSGRITPQPAGSTPDAVWNNRLAPVQPSVQQDTQVLLPSCGKAVG